MEFLAQRTCIWSNLLDTAKHFFFPIVAVLIFSVTRIHGISSCSILTNTYFPSISFIALLVYIPYSNKKFNKSFHFKKLRVKIFSVIGNLPTC